MVGTICWMKWRKFVSGGEMYELLVWIFAVIPTEEPVIPGTFGTFTQKDLSKD